MAKSLPGWMKGCAIGCGSAVVLVVVLIAFGFFFVRGTLGDFEQMDETINAVEERFGPVTGYLPDPDGMIRPERMEAFLEVREIAATSRKELAASMELLSGDAGKLRKIPAGIGLPGRISEFMTRHYRALMQVGMGPGEYQYIYALAYYSWLGKPAADGPSFQLVGDSGYIMESIEFLEEDTVRQRREENVRRGVNGHLLPVLRNLLARAATETDAGETQWRAAIEVELTALEADPRRFPWEDGLPDNLESSFLPFRDRLEESYDPLCNPLEVCLLQR